MFIKRKQWEYLNARLDKLENELSTLKEKSVASSFYFGKISFPDYVKITEREMHQIKTGK